MRHSFTTRLYVPLQIWYPAIIRSRYFCPRFFVTNFSHQSFLWRLPLKTHIKDVFFSQSSRSLPHSNIHDLSWPVTLFCLIKILLRANYKDPVLLPILLCPQDAPEYLFQLPIVLNLFTSSNLTSRFQIVWCIGKVWLSFESKIVSFLAAFSELLEFLNYSFASNCNDHIIY